MELLSDSGFATPDLEEPVVAELGLRAAVFEDRRMARREAELTVSAILGEPSLPPPAAEDERDISWGVERGSGSGIVVSEQEELVVARMGSRSAVPEERREARGEAATASGRTLDR